MLRKLTFGAALLATVATTACSKKSSDDPQPSSSAHQVQFKAETSAGSNIESAVYTYGSTSNSATSLSGTTWASPVITVPAGTQAIGVGAGATGLNANATLKVQIYVDGALKKEGTASGQYLSASATYSF